MTIGRGEDFQLEEAICKEVMKTGGCKWEREIRAEEENLLNDFSWQKFQWGEFVSL